MKPSLHKSPSWPGSSIARSEWVAAWSRVAANSFGGPAGQIAVMHDEIVTRQRWIGERRFLHALNYCMLLPGPEAQQLATYLGWMLRGPRGGLLAGAVFILPGFVSIMALSVVFAAYGDVDWVSGLFFGITAAVVAIVAGAVARIGRRVITNRFTLAIAASAFVAVFVFEVAFPAVVGAAIVLGLLRHRLTPRASTGGTRGAGATAQTGAETAETAEFSDDVDVLLADTDPVDMGAPTARRSARVLATGLALWFAPIALLALAVGRDSVYVRVAWFFSTAAVLTFGGAYSVLAYISDAAVNDYGWLQPGDMLSGLGMAETTPGPLIQVVQFVGFMGPYQDPGALTPIVAATIGAVVATWVTFVPSFLWIFLGAPHVERLRGRRSLAAALEAVTAAVVGVVLNLAVWFSIYTLFATVTPHRRFGAVVHQPALGSIEWVSLAITVAALVGVFVLKLPTLRLVAAAAVVGVAHGLIVG